MERAWLTLWRLVSITCNSTIILFAIEWYLQRPTRIRSRSSSQMKVIGPVFEDSRGCSPSWSTIQSIRFCISWYARLVSQSVSLDDACVTSMSQLTKNRARGMGKRVPCWHSSLITKRADPGSNPSSWWSSSPSIKDIWQDCTEAEARDRKGATSACNHAKKVGKLDPMQTHRTHLGNDWQPDGISLCIFIWEIIAIEEGWFKGEDSKGRNWSVEWW